MAVIDDIINVNSDFLIEYTNFSVEEVILRIWVYSGQQGLPSSFGIPITSDSNDRPFEPTYNLSSKAVSIYPEEGLLTARFNISELVKDFIVPELPKSFIIEDTMVWVDYQIEYVIGGVSEYSRAIQCLAVDGYEYSINDGTVDTDNIIRMSNRHILKDISESVKIPVLRNGMISYAFEKDGQIISSGTTANFNESEYVDDQVVYISNVASNVDSFRDRVLIDGNAVFESSECLKAFEYEFTPFAVDKVTITYDNPTPISGGDGTKTEVIKIDDIDECKYEPRQVTFINKFGAYQSVWFFKNSRRAMNVKSDSWNRRGDYTNPNVNIRTTMKYNTRVEEKITLNSGFYPENNNVVFEELVQSDSVWLWTSPTDNTTVSQAVPVNVTSTSLEFKNSVTDQMINYTIGFEFAINKMKSL